MKSLLFILATVLFLATAAYAESPEVVKSPKANGQGMLRYQCAFQGTINWGNQPQPQSAIVYVATPLGELQVKYDKTSNPYDGQVDYLALHNSKASTSDLTSFDQVSDYDPLFKKRTGPVLDFKIVLESKMIVQGDAFEGRRRDSPRGTMTWQSVSNPSSKAVYFCVMINRY